MHKRMLIFVYAICIAYVAYDMAYLMSELVVLTPYATFHLFLTNIVNVSRVFPVNFSMLGLHGS